VRFVIFGAGAIGGVVGARLHQAGHPVHLIARGAHGDAIAQRGLTLATPNEAVTLEIPVSPDPQSAHISTDDVVLLCVKGQDTWAALTNLRETGKTPTIVCLQNGVDNERTALRLFEHVYGAIVMCPTGHLEPGVVVAYAAKLTGTIDIGRFPDGLDDTAETIAAALRDSGIDSTARPDIMRHKYAKLINNVGNAIQAVCGNDAPNRDTLVERTQEETRLVLTAAGIPHEVDNVADLAGRWERWGVTDVPGHPRGGGSSWQSVMRGAGSIESDYLNGEIALLGRLHGIPAPVNALLQELAHETVRDGHRPGWLTPDEILARLR
jgi:2-dehydropantoate 2-reductase